ncbi:MAG: MBL fold metallo-hydrolase [Chloroflexota bacterium]
MPRLTFLGTGTSNGVPVIGCTCEVCCSPDERTKRTRSSAYVAWGDRIYLIDTATELRAQALRNGLTRVDAVLMTHPHADHTGGFDDLRRVNELAQAWLPVWADPGTASLLRERYAYTFAEAFPFFGGKPDLTLHEIDGPISPFEHEIVPITVMHGRLPITAYRFGSLAYVTDAKVIPPESMDLLRGVDTLVLNSLRPAPHPTHLSIGEALEVISELRPRQAFLTHMSHEVGHERESSLLPPGVAFAYDGLTVTSPD